MSELNAKNIAREQLKQDEGFSGRVYRCTQGKNTIGYGRNLDDNPLSKDEAEMLLENDLEKIVMQCIKLKYYAQMTPERRAVIINMVYNMGITAFSTFSKMNEALINHDYEKASVEMIKSKWATQVPKRAIRLSKIMAGR